MIKIFIIFKLNLTINKGSSALFNQNPSISLSMILEKLSLLLETNSLKFTLELTDDKLEIKPIKEWLNIVMIM